eukprot:m.22600 g.22600  ORF g.22600 m.22600 type:complete len:329 (-) comp3776_c0_seq1:900-1886(-)
MAAQTAGVSCGSPMLRQRSRASASMVCRLWAVILLSSCRSRTKSFSTSFAISSLMAYAAPPARCRYCRARHSASGLSAECAAPLGRSGRCTSVGNMLLPSDATRTGTSTLKGIVWYWKSKCTVCVETSVCSACMFRIPSWTSWPELRAVSSRSRTVPADSCNMPDRRRLRTKSFLGRIDRRFILSSVIGSAATRGMRLPTKLCRRPVKSPLAPLRLRDIFPKTSALSSRRDCTRERRASSRYSAASGSPSCVAKCCRSWSRTASASSQASGAAGAGNGAGRTARQWMRGTSDAGGCASSGKECWAKSVSKDRMPTNSWTSISFRPASP